MSNDNAFMWACLVVWR